MERIQHFIQRFFPPAQPLPAGIYQYQAPNESPSNLRLHLRIEPDGEGVLIVNASTVLRLNQTAAELAYHLIQQTPEDEIGKQLAARYHIDPETALKDFLEFNEHLDTLVNSPDLDPVGFLGFEQTTPYSSAISAPYRLDCALTYQLTSPAVAGLAPVERVSRELLTEEWQTILDKAWNAGIPHVIFTGGEPTLRPDLPELIAYAEKLGMVSGLLTDGLRLTDNNYLHNILYAGIDHVMLLLDPSEEQSWEALRDMMVEDLSVTVHLTLTAQSIATIPDLFDRLVKMEVKLLSLSADDTALRQEMIALRHQAAEKGLSLVWDIPVPYSTFHPISAELAEGEEVKGAGRAWLYVEPDGDVLPAQGMNQVLGNMLVDPWEKIWAKHL
jgi:hypothetical protein